MAAPDHAPAGRDWMRELQDRERARVEQITALCAAYGFKALGPVLARAPTYKAMSMEQLREELAAGRPQAIWPGCADTILEPAGEVPPATGLVMPRTSGGASDLVAAADIVAACSTAGAPELAEEFIRQGLVLPLVQAKLEARAGIYRQVRAAHAMNKGAVPMALADQFWRAGATSAQVGADLTQRLADADAAVPEIQSKRITAPGSDDSAMSASDIEAGWDRIIKNLTGGKAP